jgi:putative hydrolase of the HAD superfamily
MAANSPFDCVLLDLDDTLYPGNTGIGPALKRNIDEFLQAKLGVSAERAAAMRVELFRTHGSSLAGLIALGYGVHPDEYHSYVHGRLPYDRIAADPQLARLLQSIPQRKVVSPSIDRSPPRILLEKSLLARSIRCN